MCTGWIQGCIAKGPTDPEFETALATDGKVKFTACGVGDVVVSIEKFETSKGAALLSIIGRTSRKRRKYGSKEVRVCEYDSQQQSGGTLTLNCSAN